MTEGNDSSHISKRELPVVLETCWRAVGATNTPVACGIYLTEQGLEVRCYYGKSVEGLVRFERAADINIARSIAASWREAARANGFTELKGGH